MKKLLMIILIILLLTLGMYIAISGVNIGSVEILGINGVQVKSKELDEKIQEAAKLSQKDFLDASNNVEESAKKLAQEKKTYEEMITINTEGETTVKQIEKYEIETLWVKLGNYATSEGVVIKMDVVKGTNASKGYYNLKFTANGSYISITDFISDIENDSTLGFKIEEFKMLPSSSGSDLEATFVCKDIAVKEISETTPTAPTTPDGSTTNTNNTQGNTTNTTNTTNTQGNTTNTATNNTTTNNTTATNTNVAR